MPNALANGIAQSQVGPYANSQNQNKDQPWNNMVYDEVASNKASAGGVYAQGSANGVKAGDRGQDNGNDIWYDNGANGAGFYRQQDATQQAQSGQQYGAQQFRQNIPQTENTLFNQMSSGVNQSMNQGIKNVQQHNSNRGMLYGGVNAGQEGAVRAGAAGSLAQGRSGINSGVENAANSMDQSAIDTGVAIQQQQQQMQNAIYADAMAKMNNQNGAIGGLLGAAGTGVGMYLGAGTQAGAIGGGLLGGQAGKTLVGR
jgi:hypothetical protein